MAAFIIPRFGRWLDFTIALALGLWCIWTRKRQPV